MLKNHSRVPKTSLNGLEILRDLIANPGGTSILTTLAIICLLLVSLSTTNTTPANEQVLQAQRLLSCMFAIVIAFDTMKCAVSIAFRNNSFRAHEIISRYFVRALIFLAASKLIEVFGQDMADVIVRYPTVVAAIFLTQLLAIVVDLITGGSLSFLYQSSAGQKVANTAQMQGRGRLIPCVEERLPTARDRQYIAAHEAGHVLVLAGLERLPPGVHAQILPVKSDSGKLGYVKSIQPTNLLTERTYCEWYMLLLLAGKAGEQKAYNSSTLGSADDHRRWLDTADRFLSTHINGIYYQRPKNSLEQAHNARMLNSLQKSQWELLSRFFDQNSSVFHSVTNALLERGRLDDNEITSYLCQVTLPNGFPSVKE